MAELKIRINAEGPGDGIQAVAFNCLNALENQGAIVNYAHILEKGKEAFDLLESRKPTTAKQVFAEAEGEADENMIGHIFPYGGDQDTAKGAEPEYGAEVVT